MPGNEEQHGLLASQDGKLLPLEVLNSPRGYYLGTRDQGIPYSRESEEYFGTEYLATVAMETGDWAQRTELY